MERKRDPTRAVDDFTTIRARMEELRREREGPQATESDLQRDLPLHRARRLRWTPSEIGAGSARVPANPVQEATERCYANAGFSRSGVKKVLARGMTPISIMRPPQPGQR